MNLSINLLKYQLMLRKIHLSIIIAETKVGHTIIPLINTPLKIFMIQVHNFNIIMARRLRQVALYLECHVLIMHEGPDMYIAIGTTLMLDERSTVLHCRFYLAKAVDYYGSID